MSYQSVVVRGLGVCALALLLAVTALAQAIPDIGTAVPEYLPAPAPGAVLNSFTFDSALEDQLLKLDPNAVTGEDVRNILARCPAPRVINIHGGVPFVYLAMVSLSKFLVGMGYPEDRIRLPSTGEFSWNPYGESAQEAGIIAALYEREGLTPMLIGHSQGGIQVVKILYELAGEFRSEIPLWNPYLDRPAGRTYFVDPLTGAQRAVIGLQIGYASAVAAGGSALLLANHWSMAGRLRIIPNSVVNFTGFSLPLDFVALDGLDGARGRYSSAGSAQVRNITLPASYSHVSVPATSHLLDDANIRQWINDYRPEDTRPLPTKGDVTNILYASDVWYSVKRHWVLALQDVVRARRANVAGR